jgi:hypothetical protein
MNMHGRITFARGSLATSSSCATAPRGEACDAGGWAHWNRIRGGPLNKTIRIYKELPRMASTIKMPPKQQTNEEVVEPRAGQGRSVLHCLPDTSRSADKVILPRQSDG